MGKDLKIIKNRSDIGAGTRGSDLGVDALEIAAIINGNHFFNIYNAENIDTHNETIYNKDKNSFAKRITHVVEQCQRVSDSVYNNLENGFFPIILSGDHSSALGTISGIKKKYPDKKLGVIWIDAHADIHSPYTSPSGNIHGMPLAAAMNMDHKEIQINNINESTVKQWELMKNIGINGPKITPDSIIYFGVRSTELPEDELIEKYNIKNYTVSEMRFRGIDNCMNEAIQRFSDIDIIYVSFDVDSMDADMISYGTGTPVPKGFDENEIKEILKNLVKTNKIVGFECAEINPLLDTKGNKMAETAFDVIDYFVSELKQEKIIN